MTTRQKSPSRIAAEQAVLKTLTLARDAFWTLRQLRFGLRAERERFHEEWEGSEQLWYAAIRTVAGCRLTDIQDPRQLLISDWRST